MEKVHRKPTIALVIRPFQEFAEKETSGGILLFLSTVVAVAWANSPWSSAYFTLWGTKFTIGLGKAALSKPLLLWINEGLMTLFFLVVGLEIKRELLTGELASPKQSALPIAAALGGMLAPAGIYIALNAGGPGARGWGIPMATDIAFSLGVMALLGNRVPFSLKVFLTAFAIVDDIGGVLVIALFYTREISWIALAGGAVFLLLLLLMNWAGVQRLLPYGVLGTGLWLAFLESGIHATISGVLLAMTIPSRARLVPGEFLSKSRAILAEFEHAGEEDVLTIENRQAAIRALERACALSEAPMQRLEHTLHPWVTFGILPLFALANAGVSLAGDLSTGLLHPVSLGVILGLVLGKQVGIPLFAWLAVRTGLATRPTGTTWGQIYAVGWLGGIGFTMSLFIASLAFGDTQLLPLAKVGIFTASLVAGVGGWLLLRFLCPPPQPPLRNA